jgi:hypothetical protein
VSGFDDQDSNAIALPDAAAAQMYISATSSKPSVKACLPWRLAGGTDWILPK